LSVNIEESTQPRLTLVFAQVEDKEACNLKQIQYKNKLVECRKTAGLITSADIGVPVYVLLKTANFFIAAILRDENAQHGRQHHRGKTAGQIETFGNFLGIFLFQFLVQIIGWIGPAADALADVLGLMLRRFFGRQVPFDDCSSSTRFVLFTMTPPPCRVLSGGRINHVVSDA
jgi:hypothetical protein